MIDKMAVFEAVQSVQGEVDGLCGAEAPSQENVPCTRLAGHAGEHIAAHTDSSVLARWWEPEGFEDRR
jgi:hypothetical protein